MNKEKWLKNFDDKVKGFDLHESKSMYEFIEKGVKLINIEEYGCDDSDILDYLCGKRVDTKTYKILRKNILQNKFNIKTCALSDENVLLEARAGVISLLIENYLKPIKSDCKLIEIIMEQILTFKWESAKFSFEESNNFIRDETQWDVVFTSMITMENQIGKSDINFQNIIEVTDIKLMYKLDDNDDYDIGEKIYTLKCSVKDYYETKFIEINFIYGKDEDIEWYDLVDNSYISSTVKYCNTKYSWEDYISESYKLYKTNKFRLAFLQAFVGFDSFVENSISLLKEIVRDEIYDLCKRSTENLRELINNIYVGLDKTDESIGYLLYYYNRLCKDARDLINDKFVDIMNINNYIHNSDKNNLFGKQIGKYVTMKNKLIELKNIRNELAHGNSLNGIDFQIHYLSLITIIFEILIDFKGYEIKQILY